MRQYTAEELQSVADAEKQLREKGLILDESAGKASADQNSKLIADHLEKFGNTPLTVQSVLDAVEALRGQLIFKSALELEYDSLYGALPPADQQRFGMWWFNQKNTLILDGEAGFENAAQILVWMRGRSFDQINFDLALSNLAANSRRPIHWAVREQANPGRLGHTSDGKGLFSKDDTNLSARDHARRAAEAAGAGRISSKEAPDYRARAEALKGGTHSKTEQISKLFVIENGRIDWEKTYISRRKAAGL